MLKAQVYPWTKVAEAHKEMQANMNRGKVGETSCIVSGVSDLPSRASLRIQSDHCHVLLHPLPIVRGSCYCHYKDSPQDYDPMRRLTMAALAARAAEHYYEGDTSTNFRSSFFPLLPSHSLHILSPLSFSAMRDSPQLTGAQFLAVVDGDDFGRCGADDEDSAGGFDRPWLTGTGMVKLGVVEMCPFGSALRSTR